jgi:carbon-monoxide dehydrogenase medium subunit
MYEFKYHRPATAARHLLVKNEDADCRRSHLLPVMKQRLASPPHLVDLPIEA